MPKSTKDNGIIVACIVEEKGMSFMGTIMGLMGAVSDYDITKVPKKPFLFIESASFPARHTQGALEMVHMPLEAFEAAIPVFERKKSSAGKPGLDDSQDMLMAFGSANYCASFVHLMALNGDRVCQSWGLHLLRHLVVAKPGDVVWTGPKDHYSFASWRDMAPTGMKSAR